MSESIVISKSSRIKSREKLTNHQKSFQNNNDLEDSTSWIDHTILDILAKRTEDKFIEKLFKIDLFRRSMIIKWNWRKGFDKRMKFVEKDQYYETWYDRSYRKMYRDRKKLYSSRLHL